MKAPFFYNFLSRYNVFSSFFTLSLCREKGLRIFKEMGEPNAVFKHYHT